ncbi:MAG: alpha/beta hydrolase [Chloroflexi bacterium]|nr:alpha/beta hydrolase [Chloroflexota bacterium]
MPTIKASGITQHYELTGKGARTVAWIHGIGGSLQYWKDDLQYFPGFRHLTYDVRGMGKSEGTDGPVSLEIWARDLAALLDALAVPRAIIAGSSMGGAIAQRFGIDFPQKTEGLLLLSTSSRVGKAAEENWRARANETEQGGQPRLAAAQRAVAAYNMDEEIKGIRVPTLILVGDADKTTPAGGSVIISRCIPNSELEIYPGVGHAPFHEEPKSVERAQRWFAQFG